MSVDRGTRLRELASLFLKLGTISFGGPAAHVAMMEDEVVRRRRWLGRDEFLDYVGATNLIPGPNSTELAIHIGYSRAGWPGLIVAGTCFILPATLIVTGLGWAYVRFGSVSSVVTILQSVTPVVIAVVLQALLGLGRTALKSRTLVAIAIGATIAASLGVNELLILGVAGVLSAILRSTRAITKAREPNVSPQRVALPFTASPGLVSKSTLSAAGIPAAVAAPLTATLGPLFLIFLKIGAVLFGSGYVLLAFLRTDLVERLHWLTETQLLDAIVVGQVTPGPVFTTATFIGYVLRGPGGAAAATLGIFLPAFVFVAISGPVVPRLRRSPTAGAVLDGVNVASLALMAVVAWQLGRSALIDLKAVALCAASALLLIRWRVNSAWLVLAGALVGFGTSLVAR